MFVLEEIAVEDSVADVKFACDLNACKGACCTMQGRKGAPLLDIEIEDLRRALPVVKKYLSPDHLRVIEREGPFEGKAGSYATTCFNDRACVFVSEEQGVAKCSFEKAFVRGEIPWRKPISCHLFPIRIDGGRSQRVRFEYISECRPALDRGDQEDVQLSGFVKDALIRAYGESWYDDFLRACAFERENRGELERRRDFDL